VALPLRLAAVCLVLSGAARADDTNIVWPVVSVQTVSNTAVSGATPGVFTVQRTGDTGLALVVNYRITGTATNGADYQRLSGTVTIPAGQSSARIEVAPIDRQQPGSAKNVTLTLAARNQPFSIVALPDTQNYYVEYFGAARDIFTSQIQWILDRKDALNIAFVLHEGDVTELNSTPEWVFAKSVMNRLDGVLPYAVDVGNHDGTEYAPNQTAPFNQYFPLSQYKNLPTFGGVFESNRMDNCYHLFTAGGVDWLILSLEYGPRNAVLAWANQVVTNYPNRRVIVLTHAYLGNDNTLLGTVPGQVVLPTTHGRDNDGTGIWEKLVRRNPNSALVFCGHILGIGRLMSTGDYGNRVFQMLANYQGDILGGGGYLRLAQFYPDQDKMTVSTYSPYLDNWLTDPNNQFVYTNLGIFTSTSPGYLLNTQYTSASLIITNGAVDLTPPAVTNLTCMGMPPVIKITFNEPVEVASAQTLTNYSLDQNIQLTGATLSSDGRTVALALGSDPVANRVYNLTVNHVKDNAAAHNEMTAAATVTFTYQPILLADDFTDGNLTGWKVVDEGIYSTPSFWLERSGRLIQISNIYGQNGNAVDHRKGTFVYWNDPPALAWSDYAFSVTFKTQDDDGVGVMFRYRNPSNYFKVELDAQKNFRKLFKLVNGVETTLAAESAGYLSNSNYVLRIETTNSDIAVLLNGTVLFGGTITDSNSLTSGTVALYCWGSQGALFNNLRVTPLRRFPRVTISAPTNNATFVQPASFPISVDTYDPDGHVTQVTLYQGNFPLATLTNAPYGFQWSNMPAVSYTLTARILDDAGLVGFSPPVNITVLPPPPKPYFVVEPVNQSVRAGSGTVFSGRADGPTPIFYQWLHNGVPLIGATNTFLILNNVQSASAGTNTLQASNQWGSVVSEPATLTVTSPILPVGDTNTPPGVHMAGVTVLDPGVPVVSVDLTNVTVVRIDWTSNFLSWLPLLTITNSGDTAYFSDPAAASQPRRFYRAVAQQ
jgi:hypothetical protein